MTSNYYENHGFICHFAHKTDSTNINSNLRWLLTINAPGRTWTHQCRDVCVAPFRCSTVSADKVTASWSPPAPPSVPEGTSSTCWRPPTGYWFLGQCREVEDAGLRVDQSPPVPNHLVLWEDLAPLDHLDEQLIFVCVLRSAGEQRPYAVHVVAQLQLWRSTMLVDPPFTIL